jgi:hypothetical protein
MRECIWLITAIVSHQAGGFEVGNKGGDYQKGGWMRNLPFKFSSILEFFGGLQLPVGGRRWF